MMLRFRAGRLERTREDSEFGVTDVAGHLRVRHVLVDEDPSDESGVGEGSSDLAIYLDEIEGDVFSLEVGDR